ncbi:MAG: rRNA small subunit methyltransferase 1 [Candidatus Magasanikbacteria bacterium]|nr:rRNA small subunit methyltransferase 1 [Candidatus Magasanikbacteria bacterium]
MQPGKLYIVATPIGNLADITLRALETLKSVDVVLCEDTRVSKNLLDHYQISKPLISYHQHTEVKKIKEIIAMLEEGKNLALVTDAGTPGISDPGGLLIHEVVRSVIPTVVEGSLIHSLRDSSTSLRSAQNDSSDIIIPIPGPSAAIAALSISGFPTDKFVFMGFPPHKNKRQKYFKEVAACEYTIVFYESGHRIKKCLQELKEVLDAKRQIMVCRELTKKFETVYRGTIEQVTEKMQDERGEFVIVVNTV